MSNVIQVKMPTYEEMTNKKEGDIYACFMALVLDPYLDSWGESQPFKVLMNHRWDGLIGLPGGKVDYHWVDGKLLPETLKEACIREVWEEIGMRVHARELQYLCTHEFPRSGQPGNKVNVSMFYVHADVDSMKDVSMRLDITEVSGVEYMSFETIKDREEITCDSVAEEMEVLEKIVKERF